MFKLSSFEKEVLTTLKTHGYKFIARDYDGTLFSVNDEPGNIKVKELRSFVDKKYFEFIKNEDDYILIDKLLEETENEKD